MPLSRNVLAAGTLAGFLLFAAGPAFGEPEVFPLRPFAEEGPAPSGGEAGRGRPEPSFLLGGEAAGRIGPTGISSERAGIAPKAYLAFSVDAEHLDLVAHLSANTDAKYGPALADLPGGNLGQVYFIMEEGGVSYHGESLRLTAGRFRHYDVVDSPYSLFVNGSGRPATLMSLAYDDGFFFYESRWIELTRNSTMSTAAWGVAGDANTGSGFPDRGANVKTYGLRLPNGMRFGYQDASTYSLRSFDLEYFLNPIPQYFIQYAQSTGGRPWATELDDGNMIGAFWDWKLDSGLFFLAQVLMDDFNLGGLFGSVLNPNQVAFSLGGGADTSLGRFSLFAAGATKFTFEPAPTAEKAYQQAMVSYGYTYFPDTRFDYDRHQAGFQAAGIEIEDNAIGYQYGQNNLALRAAWRGRSWGFDLGADLEFRLMGENSPANAWHDAVFQPEVSTLWLDSPVLEKRILGGFTAATRVGAWRFSGTLSAGVAFDALELRPVDPSKMENHLQWGLASWSKADTAIYIYRPIPGNTRPIFKLTLGVAYEWRL